MQVRISKKNQDCCAERAGSEGCSESGRSKNHSESRRPKNQKVIPQSSEPGEHSQALCNGRLYVLQHHQQERLHGVKQVDGVVHVRSSGATACGAEQKAGGWGAGARSEMCAGLGRNTKVGSPNPTNVKLTCTTTRRHQVLRIQTEAEPLRAGAAHELQGAVGRVVRPHRAPDRTLVETVQVGVCMGRSRGAGRGSH